jgi:tungstate transport system ATP-binding protein
MKLLCFLERPTSGSIAFDGRTFGNDEPIPKDMRTAVSLVMQDHYLFEGTVSSNVSYGLKLRRFKAPAIDKSVAAALEAVGLAGFQNRKAGTLSGGEEKRVAIARAVVLKPKALLLDEPTANIDRNNSEMIERIIRDLKSQGMTVVMSTHDIAQAYRLSDRVISLIEGRITDASPENVFPCQISGGTATLRNGIAIQVVTTKSGNAYVAIDPQDIIISLDRLQSSARNCISGTVRQIVIEDTVVKVRVDAGIELLAVVTRNALEELGLSPGSNVFLTFKATSVRVF